MIDKERIAELEAENERLRVALREIADPISFMRQRAEDEDHRLDGQMAVFLSRDANFLKSIAGAALNEIKDGAE